MLSGELPVVTGLKKKTTLAFEALVTASGRVVRVYVPQGSRTPVLLNRAVAAARAWQFERLPRNRNGVSERCRIILTFRPADG